jgi:hypothetical protein
VHAGHETHKGLCECIILVSLMYLLNKTEIITK